MRRMERRRFTARALSSGHFSWMLVARACAPYTPRTALGAEEGQPPAALRRPLQARGGHTQVEASQCVGTLPLLLVCGHFDVIHDERHPATKHVHSGTREGRVGDDCRGGAKLEATSSSQRVLNTLGPPALPRTREALDVAHSCVVAQPSQELCHLHVEPLFIARLGPYRSYIRFGTLVLTDTRPLTGRGSRTVCAPLP